MIYDRDDVHDILTCVCNHSHLARSKLAFGILTTKVSYQNGQQEQADAHIDRDRQCSQIPRREHIYLGGISPIVSIKHIFFISDLEPVFP